MKKSQTISRLREVTYNTLRAADQAVGQLHFDIGHNPKDAVILTGSARGGTTWVSELINFDKSYRNMFEPITHYRSRDGKTPLWGRYIRPGDDNTDYLGPVTMIVSGRYRNGHADRFNTLLFPRKRLVKEVGANMLMYWLHGHFPETPIILLLRHPCAVINSRLRIGWPHRKLVNFLGQEPLMTDFLSSFRSDMEAASPFEAHVMHWCIEVYVPLKQFRPGQMHLAFYENFRVHPRSEIERLFAYLKKPVDERLFERLELPSKKTRLRKSRELAPTSRFDDWRPNFSDLEICAARDVLRRFGLGSLYREDGMPDEQAALKLIGNLG